ncbi:MAG TPA: nitrous oxide reductase family maturation protein NosD [Anaeromyxobacteraceae bacterium]|nr:nitrous oxide reductase family maturation protein NosD [Anaeromyxobacteraceae bacterium]
MAVSPALVLALLSAAGEMEPVLPGALEGRPPPAEASPLQARIDAAAPGSTLVIEPGEYRGDLYLDRTVRLLGRNRPRLVGSGKGSVVRVRAPGVSVEGFDIDGLAGGDISADSSGVHVAAPGAVVRGCRIANALYGVYVREAPGAVVEGNVIRGIPGREAGEKGSGIHVWNTEGFTFSGNDIAEARDGIYIQNASRGIIRGNAARDLRYGLHYMSSDDNLFEDNLFERSAAGAVLMFSKRIQFRRNRFLHNRGFASVGLLFKDLDDSVAEDNLIADNARGIFLEGSRRNVFRRNVIAESDVAVVLYGSSAENRFEGNAFLGNLTPLTLFARRTDSLFDGNYWSGNDAPDLDGDGRSDLPYVLTSLFDHFRGNLTAADLLAQSLAAAALAAAERAFPVLDPVQVQDRAPLARPPPLPDVPAPAARRTRVDPWGTAGALSLAGVGLLVLRAGRGRRRAA